MQITGRGDLVVHGEDEWNEGGVEEVGVGVAGNGEEEFGVEVES